MARELTNQERRDIRERCMGDERCIARESAKLSGQATEEMIEEWSKELDRLEQQRIKPLLDFLKRDTDQGKPNRVLWSMCFAILQALKDYNDIIVLVRSLKWQGVFRSDPNLVSGALHYVSALVPSYYVSFPDDWKQWVTRSGLPVGPQLLDQQKSPSPTVATVKLKNSPVDMLRLRP